MLFYFTDNFIFLYLSFKKLSHAWIMSLFSARLSVSTTTASKILNLINGIIQKPILILKKHDDVKHHIRIRKIT